jgi:hypothetical protein
MLLSAPHHSQKIQVCLFRVVHVALVFICRPEPSTSAKHLKLHRCQQKRLDLPLAHVKESGSRRGKDRVQGSGKSECSAALDLQTMPTLATVDVASA